MSKAFSHLVVSGTSGVGKTFLEEELAKTGLFSPLPKIVDRPLRPKENPEKIISISKEEFMNRRRKGEFFFTLSYVGHNYGWYKKDLNVKVSHRTLAITLESLAPFLRQNPYFLPVLLIIKPENFDLLALRMKRRGDPEEKIAERLALAAEEFEKIDYYTETVKKFGGLIFEIKNDLDIPNTVIPQILKAFTSN